MSSRATNTNLYPRATVRRIVKDETNRKVAKDVDILLYLDYCLFIEDLLREASIKAKQNGESKITARHVEKVTENTLRKFKG